jgi:hypothetical protein
MLVSSLRLLKELGYYDRYLSLLDVPLRATLLSPGAELGSDLGR